MVDTIGAMYGWAKIWSDAPTEWWHIRYQPGHWHGPDPGPYGATPAPPAAPAHVKTLVAVGREVFIETGDGEVLHSWLKENVGWVSWQSLGKPGH